MSNLHENLPDIALHVPKGHEGASNGFQSWKDERGQHSYEARFLLPKAINFVDNTVAPPTEVDGDIYVLDNTGASEAGWDGAAANSWVRYNAADDAWNELAAFSGAICFDDTANTYKQFDGTNWVAFAGGGANALNDLTDVNVTGAAQGAILYKSATDWVHLAAGTSGQVLQTNGAGANPSWVNSGGNTIYNADDSLTGTRTVTMGEFNLNFSHDGVTTAKNQSLVYKTDQTDKQMRFEVTNDSVDNTKLFMKIIGSTYVSGTIDNYYKAKGIVQGGLDHDLLLVSQGTGGVEILTGDTNLATGVTKRAMSISSAQVVTLDNLSGVGSRMVVADASGVLSTQAIPSGGGDGIYGGSGSLSGATTVTMGGNDITFTGGQFRITGGVGDNPLQVDTNTINNALLVDSSGQTGFNTVPSGAVVHISKNGVGLKLDSGGGSTGANAQVLTAENAILGLFNYDSAYAPTAWLADKSMIQAYADTNGGTKHLVIAAAAGAAGSIDGNIDFITNSAGNAATTFADANVIVRIAANQGVGFLEPNPTERIDVNGNVKVNGYHVLHEVSAPSTPSTGLANLYVKSDGKIYLKNDAGTEYDLTGTGAGGDGNGIYDGSGSLSGATTVTQGANTLTFDRGANGGDAINITGAVASAVKATIQNTGGSGVRTAGWFVGNGTLAGGSFQWSTGSSSEALADRLTIRNTDITNGIAIATQVGSIRMYTGGLANTNRRFEITDAGSVGVVDNTTTPTNDFHVKKTKSGGNVIATCENVYVGLGSMFKAKNSLGDVDVITGSAGGTTDLTTNKGVIRATQAAGFGIAATNAAGSLFFYTGGEAAGNKRMTIGSTGLVGINTVPTLNTQVHISGASGNAPLRVDTNTVNNALTVGSNGKVGIGVSPGNNALHIVSSRSLVAYRSNGTSLAYALVNTEDFGDTVKGSILNLYQDGNATPLVQLSSRDGSVPGPPKTEDSWINNGGKFGINTDTPQHELDVNSGRIRIGNTVGTPTVTNGGVLYVEGSALKYRSSVGTITTIAPA